MCALTISRLSVARVAKLVDALASGASAFAGVLVRVQSRAPDLIPKTSSMYEVFLYLQAVRSDHSVLSYASESI